MWNGYDTGVHDLHSNRLMGSARAASRVSFDLSLITRTGARDPAPDPYPVAGAGEGARVRYRPSFSFTIWAALRRRILPIWLRGSSAMKTSWRGRA